jgi:hypothetical protein
MTARTLTGIVLAAALAGGLAIASPAFAQEPTQADSTKQREMPSIRSVYVDSLITPQQCVSDFLSKKEYREAAKYFADHLSAFGECERPYLWGRILAGMAENTTDLAEEICFTTAAYENLLRAKECDGGSWYESLRSGEKFFLNMDIHNLEVKLRKLLIPPKPAEKNELRMGCYSEEIPLRAIRPADIEDLPILIDLPSIYIEQVLRNNPPNIRLYPPAKPTMQK